MSANPARMRVSGPPKTRRPSLCLPRIARGPQSSRLERRVERAMTRDNRVTCRSTLDTRNIMRNPIAGKTKTRTIRPNESDVIIGRFTASYPLRRLAI